MGRKEIGKKVRGEGEKKTMILFLQNLCGFFGKSITEILSINWMKCPIQRILMILQLS